MRTRSSLDLPSSGNRPLSPSDPSGRGGRGSYTSKSSGTERSVQLLPKDITRLVPKSMDATVKPETIRQMREAVAKHYGQDVADTAFREIAYRTRAVPRGLFGTVKGKSIKGRHLVAATQRALELASPRIGAQARKVQASAAVEQLTEALATARKDLASTERRLDGLRKDRDDYGWSPLSSKEIQAASDEIEALKHSIKDLEAGLSTAREAVRQADSALEEFTLAPLDQSHLGKAQQALDHVAGDVRFFALLNDTYARGQAIDRGGGTLHRTFSKNTAGTVGKEVLGYALPPIAVGKAFYSAIKAEDRERRFAAAAKHLDANPLTRAMAGALSGHAETEKWKLGIGGTVGFVAMGLAPHLGPLTMPGLGLATAPLTKAVDQGVVTATSHGLGRAGAGALGTTASKATGYAVHRTSSELGGRGLSAAFVPPTDVGSQLTGMSLPTIPVSVQGSDRIKEFDVSDPKVAKALLHYLGPKVDSEAIGKGSPEEKRRKQLRDLIGVKDDNEHLVPGESDDPKRDQAIAEALDNPRASGASDRIRSVSPLRLMYISQGW